MMARLKKITIKRRHSCVCLAINGYFCKLNNGLSRLFHVNINNLDYCNLLQVFSRRVCLFSRTQCRLSGSCCCYFCERDDSDNMFAPNFGAGAKNKPRRLIIGTLMEHVTKPERSCLINHTTNSWVAAHVAR